MCIRDRGIKYDKIFLFITDVVSYMKKAAEALCVSYSKLIHVSCVVHALHRMYETIKSLYPNEGRLISNGKKVFVNSPMRIDPFKNKNSNLPLPPATILIHW